MNCAVALITAPMILAMMAVLSGLLVRSWRENTRLRALLRRYAPHALEREERG